MKNSKFVFCSSPDYLSRFSFIKRSTNEIMTILKSKRDEIVFRMKLTSKDEFDIHQKE